MLALLVLALAPALAVGTAFSCNQYAYYNLGSVTQNDLSGSGLIYAGTVQNGAASTVTPYEIHVNVTGGSSSSVTMDLSAPYARVRQNAGSSTTFQLKKWDTSTNAYVKFTEFYLSFYDIDKGSDGGKEIVHVNNWDHAWLAQLPEVNAARQNDGSMKFEGEQTGTSSATRGNSLDLSNQDYRRMVTVRFHEVTTITFSLQVSGGSSSRYFLFVARPILRCANAADGGSRRLSEYAGPASGAYGRGPCAVLLAAAFLGMLQQLLR